jgi:hypothetical protein
MNITKTATGTIAAKIMFNGNENHISINMVKKIFRTRKIGTTIAQNTPEAAPSKEFIPGIIKINL